MRMKKVIIIFSLIILGLIVACDNYTHNSITNTDPANYINLDLAISFGGSNNDWGEDIKIVPDYNTDEYKRYIAGVTTSYGSGSSSSYLLKVDENNQLVWQYYYGGRGEDGANSIEIVEDTMIFLLGYTTSFDINTGKKVDPAANPSFKFDDINFYLIKTNLSGITYWEKCYGTQGSDETGIATALTDDGIIAAGRATSSGGDNIYLSKIDFNGNQIWSSLDIQNGEQQIYDIVKSSDGNFIAAGTHRNTLEQNHDAYFTKFTSGGDPVWHYSAGETDIDEGINALIATDDGVIGAGFLKVNGDDNLKDGILLIIKLDLAGNLVWKYSYVTVKGSETSCIEQTYNDDFIVISNNIAADETTYTKFDANGQLLWTQQKGVGAAKAMQQIPDDPNDRYIITGKTFNPTAVNVVNAAYVIAAEDLTNVGQ